MKTALDKITREELIGRIGSIDENSKAQWGKMNVQQMVEHCIRFEEMIDGDRVCKPSFVGRIIGPVILKKLIEKGTIGQNAPTANELVVSGTGGDINAGKKKWIGHIKKYEHFSNDGFIHPFFRKMTREQVGYLVYIHYNHHLQQFGA